MDSIKIGPKTWATFRQNLDCAGQQKDLTGGGSVALLHAKPLLASEASDVVEMDKIAEYAATGRSARRGAVVYSDATQLFMMGDDGVMSTP
jgi:hypothetical protein